MALFPPTNLTLGSVSAAGVVLNWGLAPQASSYNLYRDQKKIATGIAGLTFTDATVKSNTRYAYRVSATVGAAETPQSNKVDADVLFGTTLTFESAFQEMPGEGGYPDILWRWQ